MLRKYRNLASIVKAVSIALLTIVLIVSQTKTSAEIKPKTERSPSSNVLSQIPNSEEQLSQTSSISAEFPYESKFVEVLGSKMSYVEKGKGEPILFLHGIPTSSYLWRNVLPEVESSNRRVIAVDLIGFGRSDKPDITYGFFEQARYLNAFIEELGLENVTLVTHDWGAGLGLHYAWQHPDNIKGFAYLEAALPPVYPRESFASFGPAKSLFRSWRDPVQGPEMLIDQNFFVEKMIPRSIIRKLSAAEMKAYRAPFANPKDRRAIYDLVQDLPVGGEPADVTQVYEQMASWWSETEIPKLAIYADPGRLTSAESIEWAVTNLKNIETAFVGEGIHFIQEDNPQAVGRAIDRWISSIT